MRQRSESQYVSDWLSERGTALAIRFTAEFATTFGRTLSRVLVRFSETYDA